MMAAEFVEGRVLTERNVEEPFRDWTPCRNIALSQLVRVQEAASKDRKQIFAALLHQALSKHLLFNGIAAALAALTFFAVHKQRLFKVARSTIVINKIPKRGEAVYFSYSAPG